MHPKGETVRLCIEVQISYGTLWLLFGSRVSIFLYVIHMLIRIGAWTIHNFNFELCVQFEGAEMLCLPIRLLLQSRMPEAGMANSQGRMCMLEEGRRTHNPRCGAHNGQNHIEIERWRRCGKRLLHRKVLSQIQRSHVTWVNLFVIHFILFLMMLNRFIIIHIFLNILNANVVYL